MRRSSRILCFLAAMSLAPPVAEARGGFHGAGLNGGGLRGGFGARPFGGMPRGPIRLGVGRGLGRGFGLRFRGRPGRYGGGFGFGGYGAGIATLGDVGLGSLGTDLPTGGASSDFAGDPGGRAPVFVPVAVPPPTCPMIIAVNGGLRNAARTRVVYGSQPTCRR